jgi:hypothetical protein
MAVISYHVISQHEYLIQKVSCGFIATILVERGQKG